MHGRGETSGDEDAVRAVCRAYGEAMRAMDLEGLERQWDAGFEHLVYQPEEHARALRSWDEIQAYWRGIPDVVEAFTEWREIATDVAVIGDVALVYALLATAFRIAGVDEPLAGEVRFTYGLRRTPGGWRLIHAHESRQLVVDDAAH